MGIVLGTGGPKEGVDPEVCPRVSTFRMFLCVFVYVLVSVSVSVFVYVYVCVSVCLFVCVCGCVCACVSDFGFGDIA